MRVQLRDPDDPTTTHTYSKGADGVWRHTYSDTYGNVYGVGGLEYPGGVPVHAPELLALLEHKAARR